MNRYMEKTILGLSVVLVSASLLTACNTVKGTANGIEHTAVAVGQTVTGTVVGAEKDVKATEKAMKPAHKAAHKKAMKKVHHKAHHKTMKKMDEKPAEATEAKAPVEANAPAAQ